MKKSLIYAVDIENRAKQRDATDFGRIPLDMCLSLA